MKSNTKRIQWLAPLLGLALLLGACTSGPRAAQPSERQAKAMAMWQERCKTAGEKIYKTVEGVEGISTNDEYLMNFLRGYYHQRYPTLGPGFPPRVGFRYIEAQDPKDGQRYRYTGRLEQPWLANKNYSEDYKRFVLDKTPATGSAPRYGVTYDDISTREEREYWIAGSSLKVIDLQTNEVIAERIGYMVDRAQGNQSGGRSPWLFAADNACPDFNRNRLRRVPGPGFSAQAGQTIDFVEQVLKPSK
jgi:hypothetical protein